jgi:beta-lactamase regulating signal transducer with metallopeptidase domain
MQSAKPLHLPDAPVPAFTVATTFPVVAVVGTFRPRMFIAESVVNTCSSEELAAICAHERAHVRQWDNLRRAAMAIAPDLLHSVPLGHRLRRAWNEAAERAADNSASEMGTYGRVSLAQALVRVARLALGAPTPPVLPASALYHGGSVEARVRSLLEPSAPPAAAASRTGLALVSGAVAVGMIAGVMPTLIELALKGLP